MGNAYWNRPMITNVYSNKPLETILETLDEDVHEAVMYYETEIPKRLQYVEQGYLVYQKKNVFLSSEIVYDLKRRLSTRHNYHFQFFGLSMVHDKYGIVFELRL
jgi:hypothetical protein